MKYDHERLKEDYKGGMGYKGLRRKYGIDSHHARTIMRRAGIARNPSEAMLFKAKGWRKLTPMRAGNTRILSLPASVIRQLGFDPSAELEAKWQVSGEKLTLQIRKAGRRGRG